MKKIIIVGITYGKSLLQTQRMINSFDDVKKYSKWVVLYDEVEEKKLMPLIKKYGKKFVKTSGIRNERIVEYANSIKSDSLLLIIDGDDKVHKKDFIKLAKIVKKERLFLNDLLIFNYRSHYFEEDILMPKIKNFYHSSLPFISNHIFNARAIRKLDLNKTALSTSDKKNFIRNKWYSKYCEKYFFFAMAPYVKKVYFVNVNLKSPYTKLTNSSTSVHNGVEKNFTTQKEYHFISEKEWKEYLDFKNENIYFDENKNLENSFKEVNSHMSFALTTIHHLGNSISLKYFDLAWEKININHIENSSNPKHYVWFAKNKIKSKIQLKKINEICKFIEEINIENKLIKIKFYKEDDIRRSFKPNKIMCQFEMKTNFNQKVDFEKIRWCSKNERKRYLSLLEKAFEEAYE